MGVLGYGELMESAKKKMQKSGCPCAAKQSFIGQDLEHGEKSITHISASFVNIFRAPREANSEKGDLL
jgi:hypothetical protein